MLTWCSCCVVQMTRGSPVGMLTGSGYSLIPRDSRAAFHHLFEQARLHPDLDANEEDEEHLDGDIECASGCSEETEDGSTINDTVPPAAVVAPSWIERAWSPSAQLLSHFPPILKLPFCLLGTWNAHTGQVRLIKRHNEGEVNYEGEAFLFDSASDASSDTRRLDPQAPAAALSLALHCEFAVAELNLTVATSVDIRPIERVPQSPPPLQLVEGWKPVAPFLCTASRRESS